MRAPCPDSPVVPLAGPVPGGRRRRLTSALLCGLLLAALAGPATADEDEDPTVWTLWARDLPLYEPKVLLPVAILTTLPAVLVATPFELTSLATSAIGDAIGGGEEAEPDEDDEYDPYDE